MSLYFLLALCGCLAGVTTVLFGFGGGFIVVPLLYRLLGGSGNPVAMQVAVATSTCVMVSGALLATLRQQRSGLIDWSQVRPLLLPIACGAVLGAAGAASAPGDWLRWAFVAYLGLTILDSLLRPGFMAPPMAGGPAPSATASALPGLLIGAIAALLGVGGSVMTVPLMRRRGAPMRQAAAMANPLSLPVALAGAATYAVLSGRAPATLGDWHLGLVDLRALAVLVAGSWIGIRAAAPLAGRIPDALHARVYLGLLGLVILAMVLG